MNILNRIKRIYYKIKNRDPLHNCEVVKNDWCNIDRKSVV